MSEYVIDQETKIRYTLGQKLGEGATARVLLGTCEGQPPVAVKIAFRGTSAGDLEMFDREVEILNQLAQTEAKACVPWAHRGEMPADPQAHVIILEFVPDEWQLSRMQEQGKLPIEIALPSALQYALLLKELHRLGFSTRGDRKTTDLRWDDTKKRLIVLDWNRAKEMPAIEGVSPDQQEKVQTTREALVRQDIRGFGQLWSELMLGRSIRSLPVVDDETDADWASLPRGMRDILSRSLGSRAAWGYQTAKALHDDLEKYKNWWDPAQDNPQRALARAYQLHDQARQKPDPSLAHQILTLVDLAVRAGVPAEGHEVRRLQEEARKQFSAILIQAQEAAGRIDDKLKLGYYTSARQIAQEALGQIKGDNQESYRATLQIHRWLLAAHLGVEGINQGQDMSESMKHLREGIRQIETGDLKNARVSLKQAQSKIEAFLPNRLQPLQMELDIQGSLQAAQQAQDDRREERARHWFEQAVDRWDELQRRDLEYARILRAALPELDKAITTITASSVLDQDYRQKRAKFTQAVAQLMETLGNASGEWPDLSEPLKSARRSFRALQHSVGGERSEDKTLYEFVSRLGDINDCMVRGDIPEALRKAASMPEMDAQEHYKNYKKLVLSRCQQAAVARVRRLLQEGKWPDELDEAQEIDHALMELAPSFSEITALEAQDRESIKHWKNELDQFRQDLGLMNKDGQFTNNPQVLLGDLDNQQIDDRLSTLVYECQREIFDRRGLGEADIEMIRVERLLTMRRVAQWVEKARQLREIYQPGSLTPQTQALEKEIRNAKQTIGEFQQTLAGIEQAISQTSQTQMAILMAGIAAGLQAVRNLDIQGARRYKEMVETWRSLRPRSESQSKVQHSPNLSTDLTHQSWFSGGEGTRQTRWGESQVEAQYAQSRGMGQSHQAQLTDDWATSALKFLQKSIQWLEQLEQIDKIPECRTTLESWHQEILKGNLEEARKWKKWLEEQASQHPEIWQGWVIGELYQAHLALEQSQQALPSPAIGQPAPPVGSESEIKELFSKIEKAKTLEELKDGLKELEDRRDLNAGELARLQADKQKADRVNNLERQWKTWRDGSAPEDNGRLRTLLQETEKIIREANLPGSWLTILGEALNNARPRIEQQTKDRLDLLVWYDLLRRATTQPSFGESPLDKIEQTIRNCANTLFDLRQRKQLSNRLDRWHEYPSQLSVLVASKGTRYRDIAKQISMIIEHKTQIQALKNRWREISQPPGLASDLARLKELLDQTSRLMNAIPNLKAEWPELEENLKQSYETLIRNFAPDHAYSLVLAGLLYFGLEPVVSSSRTTQIIQQSPTTHKEAKRRRTQYGKQYRR